MFCQAIPTIVLLACVSVSVVGCASRSAQVFARGAAQPLPASAMKIGLMKQAQARPQDQAVERVAVAELERIGHHLVAQPEADYTLSCMVEDNSVTHRRPAATAAPYPHPQPMPYPGTAVHLESWRQHTPVSPGYSEERVEEQIPTQGIRLRLYPNSSLRAGRFETAWEGYIDAGLELRPEKQLPLVRALLLHFGRDFTGKVKLAPAP